MREEATAREFLSVKLPTDLRREIEQQAATYGLSMSDVLRLRLRNGCVFEQKGSDSK